MLDDYVSVKNKNKQIYIINNIKVDLTEIGSEKLNESNHKF